MPPRQIHLKFSIFLWLGVLQLALIFLSTSLFAEKVDLLFVVQDAGETFALLPVMRELEVEGVDYRVLAAGVAVDFVKKGEIPPERIRSFKTDVDRSWARSRRLCPCEINALVREIEAAVVVTGVAFELQGQILEAYGQQGSKTCAYWDNFNAEGENLYFSTAQSVEPYADFLLLPSLQLQKSQVFRHRTESEMIVVGQPSLQQWEKEMSQIDLTLIRSRLAIGLDQKVIVYIGGYGADYEEAFALFLESLESLNRSDFLFLVQAHPKFGGAIERDLLSKRSLNLKLPVRILEGEISTTEAVALSDLVVCHQSTVGFQALALQKPVIYLIPASQAFESLPLQKGLAKRVSYPGDFASAIDAPSFGSEFYELLGIPRQSISLFVQTLQEIIPHFEKTHP